LDGNAGVGLPLSANEMAPAGVRFDSSAVRK
jgi:hypothetical protein